MPTQWVRVSDQRTGHQYTVSAEHAEANSEHLKVLTRAHAADINGRPLPTKYRAALSEPAGDDELRGDALDQALRDAGLPTTGKADEKRQRLTDHQSTTITIQEA